jgi:hypothetical protein
VGGLGDGGVTTPEALKTFWRALTRPERASLARLTTPARIQACLDEMPYVAEERYRCPLTFLRDGAGHCFDGALFAAALLRRLGHPPRLVDLLPNDRDDDHLLAVFQQRGRWGAVAKSNFAVLRYREPVYASLRELVMSYFEGYFNVAGERTLRGYTVPLNLAAYDTRGWMISEAPLDDIADHLDRVRKVRLLTPAMTAALTKVDRRSYESGLLGADQAGLFRPPS